MGRSLCAFSIISILNIFCFSEEVYAGPEISVSLGNYDISCSEPKSEVGTNIKGLKVNLDVCNAVSRLMERSYSCNAEVSAYGPSCGGHPQYEEVRLSRKIVCKSQGGGIIELGTKFSDRISERIHEHRSHKPNGDCVRPKINQFQLRDFADKKISEFLEGQIERIIISCEELNSCTSSKLDFARFLVDNIEGSKFQQQGNRIDGRSKFGEKFIIEHDLSLLILRGTIDSYKEGGISLD